MPDDVITLVKGVENVVQNHSFPQPIAYLRAVDPWYSTYAPADVD